MALPIIAAISGLIPPALKATFFRWLAIGASMLCEWLIGALFDPRVEEVPVPPKPPQPQRGLPPARAK